MRAIVAVILSLFLAFAVPEARAAEQLNILVLGEDAEQPGTGLHVVTVRRDTRVFKQVLEAITLGLEAEGFAVFDERAITLDHFRQNRTGRSEAELLDIARSVQHPPIDAAVIFTVYAGARKLAYTTDLSARVTARIVNTKTGQKLGSFEVASPKGWKAPIGCDGDCLLETLAKDTKVMGEDIGAMLADKLVTLSRETKRSGADAKATPRLGGAYTLVFNKFNNADLSAVEEYLAAFDGYKLHRPVVTSARGTEYWYEIDSDSARLNRNLRMMLERIGTEGTISFNSVDNRFEIEKVEPRGKAKP